MNCEDPDREAARLFEAERRSLLGVAYRLLGSVSDAEDALQDVFERWLRVDRTSIENPAAYLTTMTTRAGLDRLRSAQARREVYVGPWLPEPMPTDDTAPAPDRVAELDESLTMGYLHLLEQLTPHERAAHLLHEVYDFSYREIASMIDREEANCRQLASRARSKLRASRPDPDRVPSPDVDGQFCHRLVAAVSGGDIATVMALMADDVVHISDGGPDHRAARVPVVGSDRVARLLVNLTNRVPEDQWSSVELRDVAANGQTGVMVLVGGQPITLLMVESDGQQIVRIYAVVNPDKLQSVL